MRIGLSKVVHSELSYKIYGLCFEVHNALGRYLSEKQYGDALAILLRREGIPYEREYSIELRLKEEKIGGSHFIDFLVDKKIVLELKTRRYLTKEDYYQVKRYLQATNCKLGILLNFREQRLKPKRILNSSSKI